MVWSCPSELVPHLQMMGRQGLGGVPQERVLLFRAQGLAGTEPRSRLSVGPPGPGVMGARPHLGPHHRDPGGLCFFDRRRRPRQGEAGRRPGSLPMSPRPLRPRVQGDGARPGRGGPPET